MNAEGSVRILDAVEMDRALTRIAHEIVERNRTLASLAIVGIRTRGVPLARRLTAKLGEITGTEPPLGTLDINLYRDDLSLVADHPILRRTEIPFEVDDCKVVLVDDVLFTGRTIRAALDGVTDLGRPAAIQLVVLVDRGHRELPIKADYVGKNVPTSRQQSVVVRLDETDGVDEVLVRGLPAASQTGTPRANGAAAAGDSEEGSPTPAVKAGKKAGAKSGKKARPKSGKKAAKKGKKKTAKSPKGASKKKAVKKKAKKKSKSKPGRAGKK